jgi:hypothetical protein
MNSARARPDAYMQLVLDRWAFTVQRARYVLSSSQHDKRILDLYAEKLRDVMTDVRAVQHQFDPVDAESTLADLAALSAELEEAAASAIDSSIDGHLQVTQIEHTGGPGRPKIHIDATWLATALDVLGLSLARIAAALNVSTRTVRRTIVGLGMRRPEQPSRGLTEIGRDDLDAAVAAQLDIQADCGIRYMAGALTAAGIRVTRSSVRDSLNRLQPFRAVVRRDLVGQRRQYRVAGANSVWHHDGQHGLIAFGIVIHGFIDGYSRLIPCLRASSNNRASTVLDVFKEGVVRNGLPSRVRGDRGGENVLVASYMETVRGTGRGSYLWGV